MPKADNLCDKLLILTIAIEFTDQKSKIRPFEFSAKNLQFKTSNKN